ncbi:MAG: ATP-binding protein [Thermoleophilaceae bacterium]|nr:ATP-binding protein [Thermoleophilaceae bacterium]
MEFAQKIADSGQTVVSGQRALTLRGGPGAASAARSAVDSLSGALSPECHEDIRLLVTEIVGNAVRHGGMTRRSSVELCLDVRGDCVRVEICDSGPGFKPPTEIQFSADDSGWGLYLLNQLTTDWGVERDHGARVWFELPVTGSGVLTG